MDRIVRVWHRSHDLLLVRDDRRILQKADGHKRKCLTDRKAHGSKKSPFQVQLAESNRLAFPPLLLCPKIWFNAEKAADLGLSMNALKYSISYLSDSFSEDLADVKASRNEFLVLYALNGFRSLLDYYKAISPNLQYQTPNNTNLTSLYSCRGCEAAEVAEKTILDLRLCFVFNFTPVEIGFGTYSGDRLVKIKYATRTLNLARESLDWDLYFKPSTNAFISVFPKLTVRSSYYNTIKLSEQRHVMLPSEVAPCVDKEGYSAVDCMAKCHNDMYLALLNCGLLRLSQSLKHLPTDYCNYMDRYLSENLTLSEFFASEQNARIDAAAADDCVRQCPPPCRRVIFDTTLQLQTRFSDNGEKTEEEEHETNSTRIEVHLKHAGVYQGGVMVLSEMITYTFTQWVNNVGGTLGLFVGATLMTFAQVVVFAINYTLGRVTGSESVSSMITVQK